MSAAVAAGPGEVQPRQAEELALLHRRLAVGMALAGLAAFAAGTRTDAVTPYLAGAVLSLTLFWRASPEATLRLERLWLPLALLLMLRALYHMVMVGGDVVIPVVDLLLLLMCAEGLRSLDVMNDVRLYGLSFALLLASTAYRPGVAFAVAFVAYVCLAAPALTVGHFRRKLLGHGSPEVPAARALLITGAGVSLLALGASALVFLLFPRASHGWAGRGDVPGSAVAGFSDVISIGDFGSRILPNPQIVLRVEFPEGRPPPPGMLRWRGRSYDHFDGIRWSRSPGIRSAAAPSPWYRSGWPGPEIAQRVYSVPTDARVLFALHPTLEIEPESPIHPITDNVGDLHYWGAGPPAYLVRSVGGRPSPEALREAEGPSTSDLGFYLQLPRLPPRTLALADSLTRELDNRYDKALRIETWLKGEFGYTMELPRTAREATLDHFLFERREGHCEYFSTAMVVLLRSLGIEARAVNGFLGGTWSDLGSYLAVTQNDAHSWVEVWFPGYGWVAFDPTPAGGGGSGASLAWYWPGRFVMDAVQHRWSKWVLDYGVRNQSEALGRARGMLARDGAGGEPDDGGRSPAGLWIVAALLLTASAVLVSWRLAPAAPPETRLYLRLVAACRRAGLVRGQVAPFELLAGLRSRSAAAAVPASRLVELYVRARFAGEALRERERIEMEGALQQARRALATGPGSTRPDGA